MATIKRGLNQIVFNGESQTLAAVGWADEVKGIYRINPNRTGWLSWKPGRTFNGFATLEADGFYLVDALTDFQLPDAQTIACATGPADALIPQGLSQFLYSGADFLLSGISPAVAAIYTVNSGGGGWLSWKPGRSFNGFSSLQEGRFYFVQADNAFTLNGAQTLACAETYGSENINGALYVKYPDLLGEIPEAADPKTAPNMPLFKATIAALGVTHNHDERYYQKTETLTTAEITALFSGVDEVIEVASFAALPATGLASKLYITADTDVAYRWNGTGYSPVSAPGVDLTPYLTKTEAGNTYQLKGNYLTVAAGDLKYAFKGDAFTTTQSDARYQFKGNYAPAGAYVKSVSINNGEPSLPNNDGRVNLIIETNPAGGSGFNREVEDFIYTSSNVFTLTYIPTRVYHVFPNGVRTKLFTESDGDVTVTAPLSTGVDVAIDYHHNGVLNSGNNYVQPGYINNDYVN